MQFMSCFELLVYSCSSVELGKTCSLYSQIKFILTFSSNFLQEIKYNTITIFETESELNINCLSVVSTL